MKNKITLTMMSAFIALTFMSININAQNFTGPRNMGTVLNSSSNDGIPVISPSGLSLYFASNRTGNNDIYVSQRPTLNSLWGPPNPDPTLNSIAADTPGSFSLDGKTIFLQSTRTGGFGGRDIYISTRTNVNDDFGWTTPANLGSVVNTDLDELAPAYFEDPATGAGSIIFGSNRIANPNVYHLYQSTRSVVGGFTTPTPISEINIGAEIRVAVRRDGLEMFIAAILPPPQVDFDTYVTTRGSTTDPWSTPVLVPGINSSMDDWITSLSPDGSILYFSVAPPNQSGPGDLYSVTRCSLYADTPCGVNRTVADFNGDGQTDISIFRPSDGTWWVLESGTNTVSAQQFGANGDRVVPGDYDGDGRTDMAVFRPTTGDWWILRSSDNSFMTARWGINTDKPVPGDYDGDGKTDIAVFRNGVWYILQSSNGNPMLPFPNFGLASDIPVAE